MEQGEEVERHQMHHLIWVVVVAGQTAEQQEPQVVPVQVPVAQVPTAVVPEAPAPVPLALQVPREVRVPNGIPRMVQEEEAVAAQPPVVAVPVARVASMEAVPAAAAVAVTWAVPARKASSSLATRRSRFWLSRQTPRTLLTVPVRPFRELSP